MFSVHSNIWFYILLCFAFCNNEAKGIERADDIPADKDDNLINNNLFAMIQSRMNKDDVKKSLDDFTMVRRKTHFSIPGIIDNGGIVNVKKDQSDVYPIYRSNNVGIDNLMYRNYGTIPRFIKNDNNLNEIEDKFNENGRNLNEIDVEVNVMHNNNDKPEINSEINSTEYEDLIAIEAKNDIEYLYNKYKENNFDNVLTPDQELELLKVLRKQTELIDNIKRSKNKADTNSKSKINKESKATKDKENKKHQKKESKKEKKITAKKKSKNSKGENKNKTKTPKKKDIKATKSKENKIIKNKKQDGKKVKNNEKPAKTKGKNSKDDKKKETKATKEKNSKNKKKDGKKGNNAKSTKPTTTKAKVIKAKATVTKAKATVIKSTTTKPKLTTTKTTTKPTPKKPKPDKDFDELLAEFEKRSAFAKKLPNYTPFTFETTTQTTKPPTTTTITTTKPSTVLTILNEVDVRSALRSNPFVKRILQMANRKRQKYLKESLIKIVN